MRQWDHRLISLDSKSRNEHCTPFYGRQRQKRPMMLSPTKSSVIKTLLNNALTTKINDREMYMKGIDYSYYYEETD